MYLYIHICLSVQVIYIYIYIDMCVLIASFMRLHYILLYRPLVGLMGVGVNSKLLSSILKRTH